VRVEIRGAGDDASELLGRLPGVAAVDRSKDGVFLIEHDGEADPREAVFHLAVDRGWILLGLTQAQATLEDVFVRLTTADDVAAVAAHAAEEV
jgi:ABC-type uncharacterized transport system ATPase subunit